jgi:hypothetical protein
VTRSYERCADRLELVWSERIPANPGWPKAFRFTGPRNPPPDLGLTGDGRHTDGRGRK